MIFVECNPDKFVVRKIVTGKRKQIKHGGGKTGVLHELDGKGRAVGIVNADPDNKKPPGDMKKYSMKDARGTIKLLGRKDDSSKSLIELFPDLEGWMINRAKKNGISLRDYGLPDDRKKMHDILHIEKNLDFQKFIKMLIRSSDDEVNALRRWIREAME